MTRVGTAAIGLPLVVGVTYWGPHWMFLGLVAITSTLALDEFLDLAATGRTSRVGRWFLPLGAAVTASFALGTDWVLGTFTLALVTLMTVTLAHEVRVTADRITAGAAGLAYVSILIGFLVLLPPEAVLSLFGIVWAGDTAAYYGGRALGRHRLASEISPGKTVEGAVAGALASLVAGIALMNVLMGLEASVLAAGTVLLTAIAGQTGDLAESALKRSVGIKDSSGRLPGHGGVLDRIDSLLFAAPVFYFCL